MSASLGEVPSDYNATTLTYCDLLVLDKAFFDQTLDRFPVVRRAIRG